MFVCDTVEYVEADVRFRATSSVRATKRFK